MLDDQSGDLSASFWPGEVGRPESVLLGAGAQILSFSPTEAQVQAALQ